MSATKKEKSSGSIEVLDQQETKKKTCFVIMPIADHPEYEKGHFNRVYEYLIKPACEEAGYEAVRADDSKASHMIMFDILKKIVECDMAICDLTTKNANVFYELGLRQAFNKKTILITDGKEKAPFDISGFRYAQYSPSLRVDETRKDINEISRMLAETELAPESDVNSIVKLLEIEPAKIEHKSLNSEESILFKMLIGINDRLDKITDNNKSMNITGHQSNEIIQKKGDRRLNLYEILLDDSLNPYNYEYYSIKGILGIITEITSKYITFSGGVNYSNDRETLESIKVHNTLS